MAAMGGLGGRRGLRGRQAAVIALFAWTAVCGALGRPKTREMKGVGVFDSEETPLSPVLTTPCPTRDSS